MFSISEQEAARQAAKLYAEIRDECCDNETSSLPLNKDNFDRHQFEDLLKEIMDNWDIKGYCSLFAADTLSGVRFNHRVCFDYLTGDIHSYSSKQEEDGLTWNGDDMYYKSYATIITDKKYISKIDLDPSLDYTDSEVLESLACNVINTLLEHGLLRYRYRSFDDLPKTKQNVIDTTRLDDSEKKGYEKAVKFILTVIDKPDSYYYDVPEELFALKGKSVLSDCTTSDIQLLEKHMGLNPRNEQITVLLKEEISDE